MSPSFQSGWSAVGILLLRAAGGATFIVQGAAWLAIWHQLNLQMLAIALLTVVSGALLVTGYRTRLAAGAAVMVGVVNLFSWFPYANVGLFATKTTVGFASVVAAALVCVGPGTFSLDGRLFGRREIVIPRPEN